MNLKERLATQSYKEQIELLIHHIQKLNIELEIIHQFYEYTLHDLNHFEQVLKNASRICEGIELSDEEIFCLVASCYSHDLGMKHTSVQEKFNQQSIDEIRKNHAFNSKCYIDEELSYRTCIYNEEHRQAIGIISWGHGRWDWENHDFDNVYGIRIRLLTVILSLADLLDLRSERKKSCGI